MDIWMCPFSVCIKEIWLYEYQGYAKTFHVCPPLTHNNLLTLASPLKNVLEPKQLRSASGW